MFPQAFHTSVIHQSYRLAFRRSLAFVNCGVSSSLGATHTNTYINISFNCLILQSGCCWRYKLVCHFSLTYTVLLSTKLKPSKPVMLQTAYMCACVRDRDFTQASIRIIVVRMYIYPWPVLSFIFLRCFCTGDCSSEGTRT